ncbi:MAG: hypothetical protein LBV50_01270 [Novosphingobium sp.]|nr:hypothetical protein [Novosphingobium sp.]
MSRQLAISAAFSILMMAAYVLFGAGTAHGPPGAAAGHAMQIAAPELSEPRRLLPALR